MISLLSWRQMLNVTITSDKNLEKERVKITEDDIEEEVNFWNSTIFCYVLGANPPLSVIDGFARCVWKDKIDKVGMISYGVFLIRFYTIEDRDNLLNGGYIFFNKRPVVMKPWNPDCNFKKENLNVIPIWVQLENLELKYWGEKSLFKMIEQLGKPIMVDSITKERGKLMYPRIPIKVSIHQDLPDLIDFEDEYGYNTSVGVNYEWKPRVCEHCKGMGYKTIDCREKTGGTQEWIVKKKVDEPTGKDKAQTNEADTDGFQPVQKGWRPKETRQTELTVTDNSYPILEKAEMESIDEGDTLGKRKKDNIGGGGDPPLSNG
ncbi:uncharacterized protein LOC133034512 [Cannabis sativa]|uniref:uncharacterized protein LOC133034512 n=1 Tax=Cannabis sativa TaxID=3483 RepID=UPI0029C9B75F|nr:uncharacterized protein LOC133034512 [Cannabis sativa]